MTGTARRTVRPSRRPARRDVVRALRRPLPRRPRRVARRSPASSASRLTFRSGSWSTCDRYPDRRSGEVEGLAELLEGVDVERGPQGQVDLVGAGARRTRRCGRATCSMEPPSTPGRTRSAIGPNWWRRLSSVQARPRLTAHRISAGSRPTSAQWRCSTSRLAANVAGSTNGTFQPSAKRAAMRSVRFSPEPPTQIGRASWIGRGSLRAAGASRTTCPRTSSRRRGAGRAGWRCPPPAGPCGSRSTGSRCRRPGTRPRPSRRRCPSPPGRRRSGRWS